MLNSDLGSTTCYSGGLSMNREWTESKVFLVRLEKSFGNIFKRMNREGKRNSFFLGGTFSYTRQILRKPPVDSELPSVPTLVGVRKWLLSFRVPLIYWNRSLWLFSSWVPGFWTRKEIWSLRRQQTFRGPWTLGSSHYHLTGWYPCPVSLPNPSSLVRVDTVPTRTHPTGKMGKPL